jgi:hypothetical protein
MVKKTLIAVVLALVTSVTLPAQTKAAGSLTDVSGVWIMLVEGHQIGLELEQTGTAVKGVMLVMGQRQLLEGTYIDRELTLRAEKREDDASGSERHTLAEPIVARMLEDGTLAGELTTNHGRRKWTGERLQKAP